MNYGLVEDEVCNRNSCLGVMKPVDDGSSCSCHINPPCSHCVDMLFKCSKCGHETESPDYTAKSEANPNSSPWTVKYKSPQQRFNELPDNEFGYVTIAGKYYWMEHKGKYPEEYSSEKILENFNTCFGYKWLKRPKNGQFHLKVYTD